jgi:hypothetical protein
LYFPFFLFFLFCLYKGPKMSNNNTYCFKMIKIHSKNIIEIDLFYVSVYTSPTKHVYIFLS